MKKKSKCTECGQIVEYDVKWYRKCPETWCIKCGRKNHGGWIYPRGQIFYSKEYPRLYAGITKKDGKKCLKY